MSHTTTFAFNARGLLASLTDAENQTTAYVYDDYARQVTTIWPDHIAGSNAGDIGYGITRQAYDELNRLIRKTDQLGDTINFVYDVAGRLLARDYRTKANSPNGTIADSDTFSYDAAGRMLTAHSGRYGNEVAFIYDAAGRKATESLTVLGHTYVVGTQYDAAGRIAKLIYPDSSEVHRSYTARGELHQISQKVIGGSLTVLDTRVYDDAGRMISSSYDNGVSQVHSYNTDNTLAGIAFSGAAIGDLAYTWDANHNKLSESISGAMSGYGFTATYDAEDRLITYDRSNGNLDQAWDLTAVGDMNSVTKSGIGFQPVTQNRTHGHAHELLTVDGSAVSTDARGNIVTIPGSLRSNGVQVYLQYDADNRFNSLTANLPLSQPGAVFQNYSYDALGRRVGFQGNNGQTIFVCCGQQVLCDYGVTAPPSNPNMSYIYGDYVDEPIMRSIGSGGTRLYYHRNQQYSIIALTDFSGAIQECYAYSAYGELTIASASGVVQSSSSVNNRYTYTGREWDDAISQYYFRARNYDAKLRRFCSRDPIGYRSNGLNVYQSFRSNAVQNLDPSGLKCVVSKWYRHTKGDNPAALDVDFVNETPYGSYITGIMNQRNKEIGRFKLQYSFAGIKTGELSASRLPGHAGQYFDNGALFYLAADVCETNPGDCKVDFSETEIWQAEARAANGPYVLIAPGKGTSYTGRRPLARTNPSINELETGSSKECNKRIVLGDLTVNFSTLNPTSIKAWGALQIIRVYDTDGNASTMRHRFGLYTRTIPPYDIADFISRGSSDLVSAN